MVFSLGSFVAAQGCIAYLLDEFGDYGASIGAASRMLSYVLAFVLPIFAPHLYGRIAGGSGTAGITVRWRWLLLCWECRLLLCSGHLARG